MDPAPLERMLAALAHRGPDDEGRWVQGPVALGNRRLSIIDLDGGHQPMASEDGHVVCIQNGEIYNHVELHEELERLGHRFATRSDTEVLLHGYEAWGDGLLERLRGMFAIALWDSRERRLLLARDRFGIKPLYWSTAGGVLAFASELKALRHVPGIGSELDPDALEAYLAFNAIPAPLSIFRDVRKLGPGELLEWRPGAEPVVRRWCRVSPANANALRREPEANLADELRARLRDSVRAHLVSDVPVGVFLSGGVDSGTLAALAAEETPGQISTFSIGFEEQSFDELELARLVADRYGTDHHELVVRVGGARSSSCCPRSSTLSTSRSRTRPRCPPIWFRGSRPSTSRSRSPAKAATSCSAATTPTSPTCWRRAWRRSRGSRAPWSSACRRARAACRSTTRHAGSPAPRTCRRSSAITAGGRSSRRSCGPNCSTAGCRARRSIRSTHGGRIGPRPRAPSHWRGCRTSTSGSTCPATCS